MKPARYLVSAVIALSLISCKKKEEAAPQPPTQTAPPEPIKPPEPVKPAEPPKPATADDLAKRYVDCWGFFNAKDWKSFESCYAPNCISDFVDWGMPPATGWQQILDTHDKPIAEAFPDVKGDLELTLINGKYGVTVALLTGTHTGTLKSPNGDIPATNKKIGMQVAHMVHFTDDGKSIDKEWFYEDQGQMMAQLGLSPAPARPAADKPRGPNEIVIAKDDDTEKRNLEASKKTLELWNKHDAKALAAELTDDAMWSELGVPKDWNKKEAAEGHVQLFKAFSDAQLTAPMMWAAGDYVIWQGALTGTNDGSAPMIGVKKSGKKLNLNYLQVFKYTKEGKLQNVWGYWNGAAFAAQLGLMPADKAKPAGKAEEKKG